MRSLPEPVPPARRGARGARRRPSWAALCALLCALAGAAAAAPVDVTIYADDHYPPYSYLDNGRLTGIYTLIVQRALERLPGYRVQLLPVPWKRGVLMLEKGQAFALYPPYFRPAERPFMKYSEAMLTEQLVVFCNAGLARMRALKVWPDDYSGLRIGMNAGFLAGGREFDAAVKAGRLSVDAVHGSRANLLKLLRGRIDCYVNDRLSILWELEHIKKEGLMAASYLPLVETVELGAEQGFLGYTELSPEHFPFRADFVQKFNAVLREMKRSGEIKEMVTRFLLQ
ncbi:substrate-binding periplasmic protein [Janthinobacterium sp.]|uniref:substrate-binding periplasmic protein n=1 Tax=Janthinobacterium sp. TaxID=1871054 RepID=UPI00293D650C|nr:transporter substrate-binding domain-containing protein [Janthinobacterium sp.]